MTAGWSYFLDFKDQSFELGEGELTVGRSRVCDVSVDDPSVSRRHVVVQAEGGKISLKDLGSSNGTFVNSSQIQGSTELHHGDTLGLGDADLKVRIVGQSAFETVRMEAVQPPEHGEATLFLQEASAKLAQEAMQGSHEEMGSGPAPPHMAPPPPQPAPSHMAPPPPQPAPSHMAPPPPQPAPSHMAPPPPQPASPEPTSPEPALDHPPPPPEPSAPEFAASGPPASASPPSPSSFVPPETFAPAEAPPSAPPAAPSAPPAAPSAPPAAPSASPPASPSQPAASPTPAPTGPSPASPSAPAAPAPPPPAAALPAGAVPAEDVRLDQTTGELLPSLDGFDTTMGPEMLEALKVEAAQKPAPEEPDAINPYSNPYSAPTSQESAAGFGVRLAASFVDGLWMVALSIAGVVLIGQQAGGLAASGLSLSVLLFGWAIWGTTPGKRALKLHISSGNSGQAGIGFPRAIARLVGYFLSAIPFGIGFLMIAFTSSKRGLHDLVAGTEVKRQA